jgi:hypothetical protein
MGFGGGFSSSRPGGLQVLSGSDGQVLRFKGNSGKTVVGTDDLKFTDTNGLKVSGAIEHSGNIDPANHLAHSIGGSGNSYTNIFSTNVITGDLHLKNERGDWTIFEEKTSLIVQNNLTGQRFKLVMEEIED